MTKYLGAKHWKPAVLQDLVLLQRGFDITKAQQKTGDVPVFSSSGRRSWHDTAKVKGPGVIIGRKGTLGSVHYSETDYWPHDTTLWSKSLHGNNARFVFYALKCLGLERFNVGGANPTLNRNHIHGLPIYIPERSTQNDIAAVLAAYDELIENNRRRIALLEEAARLLYREWFVHLRFPGHQHVKINDGLPETWKLRYLGDVVDTQYGHTAAASDENVGPKFLRGTDINKRSFIDWSTVPHCPERGLDFQKYALVPGDILVIRMADPGKAALVEKTVRAVFASYLVRFKIRDPIEVPPVYLFMTLMDEQYQGFIAASSGGSTRKSASAKLLTDFHFLLPPKALRRLYVEQVTPMREMITKLIDQAARAAEARDLLLPRLMNGEIAV